MNIERNSSTTQKNTAFHVGENFTEIEYKARLFEMNYLAKIEWDS